LQCHLGIIERCAGAVVVRSANAVEFRYGRRGAGGGVPLFSGIIGSGRDVDGGVGGGGGAGRGSSGTTSDYVHQQDQESDDFDYERHQGHVEPDQTAFELVTIPLGVATEVDGKLTVHLNK
jgi:hypothetical protein